MNLLKPFRRLVAVAMLAAACALLVPPKAEAQQYFVYGNTTVVNGGTNNIAAGGTNSYTNIVISPTKSEYVAIGVNYNFSVAPIGVTPTLTLRLQRSLDQSNWETSPFDVLTVSGATNNLVWITNLTARATGYYRISGAENTNSAVITNLTIWYAIKR